MSSPVERDIVSLGAPAAHAGPAALPSDRWWQRLLRQPWACAGVVIVLVAVLVSLAAPWLAPYDPTTGVGGDKLLPIGSDGHLLGTDDIGRDVLSRLIWGGRTSLLVGFLPVVIATVLATVLGLVAGYAPELVSGILMRVVDILFAFPTVLFAIAFAALYGPGLWPVVLTIILAAVPYLTRVIYSEVKAERGKEYVEASRALGASGAAVLFREILPNVSAPIIVYATTWAGGMIVFAASLSAVGIGVQPPTADWGRMVADGAKLFALGAPQLSLLPGLIITLVATALNWVGDGLRDALDPYHS
ncbi:ABC transporter permease [Mycetocola reblochoni]|uniref:Dipeptide transport system permease protein DppC (TC 3.A.1.5.2) n=2 Tax=Mycetocola reblochoni TaxID=331618 RepID=A0A1R4IV13_9MICO|nr:ABC transporter permease [Mycetocola reblochoni]RLP71006.1 ABC transporter permease [Mycetocola reblochoni]SJN23716.1 Dipeptide transport system permease protein DppC (TC 3.A.1.5.2) [Mycetocola reblochoni REB411]